MDKDKIIIEVEEQEFDESQEIKDLVSVLTFRIGDETYGIAIEDMAEVFYLPEITRVPNTPSFIKGIINLRGQVIALIDIYYFMGIEKGEKTYQHQVILSDVTGFPIGIVVDRIKDTIDIEKSDIQPPLATLKNKLAQYTQGQFHLNDEIITLLNMKKILNSEEIENLRKGR